MRGGKDLPSSRAGDKVTELDTFVKSHRDCFRFVVEPRFVCMEFHSGVVGDGFDFVEFSVVMILSGFLGSHSFVRPVRKTFDEGKSQDDEGHADPTGAPHGLLKQWLNFDRMDFGMLSDQIGRGEKTVKLEARRALDCHFSSSCLFQNRSAFRFPELFHSSSFSELGGFLEGRQKPSVQTTVDEADKNEITSKRDFGNSDCAC